VGPNLCKEETQVRKFLLLTLLVVLFFTMAAGATVINFDDLGDGVVPDGYQGVTWFGQWTNYTEAQDPYNPHSPPGRVYDGVNDGMFQFGSAVEFDGAWFAGHEDATVQFQGYLNGSLVFTSDILAPSNVPTFLSSGYAGMVDTIHVLSPRPDFFIMDDVTYNSVPEPGSLLLMGTGIAGLAGYIRRKF